MMTADKAALATKAANATTPTTAGATANALNATDAFTCRSPDFCPHGVVTWAEINLQAIAHNVQQVKAHVGKDTEVIAVVKANAYGHGEIPVAHTLLNAGATRLAVHRTIDGVRLRKAGITAPILILGYTPPSGIPLVIDQSLTPTVIDRDIAVQLASQAKGPTPIHIKVDTGMCRYGLMPEDVLTFIEDIHALPHLVIEGLFSHFATADEADQGPMRAQWEVFQNVIADVEKAGFHIPLRHICNSAGLLALPEAHMEAVRPGILLYGLHPSAECQAPFPLEPALTLKSLVVRVQTLPPGSAIGYGHTYRVKEPMVVALVPIGYGDGYHRLISNRGEVLIHGQRAPVRGRVSMDQIVVDVTHIDNVQIGDEAVMIGTQGDARLTAADVATWAETIHYEVLTAVHPQVVRVFRYNGHIVTGFS